MNEDIEKIQTSLIRGEKSSDESFPFGAVVPPVFQTSTYLQEGETDYSEVKYHRLNNSPGHVWLERLIAKIEGAEDCHVCASGMAAITNTFFGLLKPGDHIAMQRNVYGGTDGLAEGFLKDYFQLSYFDSDSPDSLSKVITEATKLVYFETISNPLLICAQVEEIVALAKKNNIITVVDNTFLSPVNFCPRSRGVDLTIHSATKYLNGHSDVIAGCVSGDKDLVEKVRRTNNYFGACLDAHSISLLMRGLRTLKLRVEAQNESALIIAKRLADQFWVENVRYPGMKANQHGYRGYGGVLSFYVKSSGDLREKMKLLKVCAHAPSLGGIETLITIPFYSTHAGVSEQRKNELGITKNLVRLSVGLEDPDDILTDLGRLADCVS